MNNVQQKQFAKAEKAFQNREFQQSSELLLSLYDEVDDKRVLKLLGQSLYQEKKFVAAYRLIEDNFNYFVENNLSFVVSVYLKNHLFIPLRIIVNTVPVDNKEAVFAQIEDLEAANDKQQKETNQENVKHFMHMGGNSGIKQKEILESADSLPLSQYEKGARFNLVDPDVSPIWRVELLDNLSRLRVSDPVKFIWIDSKTYEVKPTEITPESKTATYQQLMKLIKEKFAADDPIQAQQLTEAVSYDLRLLYPFADKVITNPKNWLLALYVHLINPNYVYDKAKIAKENEWLELIDRQMKSLLK